MVHICDLTKRLVQLESVNGTPGEAKIADFIADYLRRIPYFAVRPEQVLTQSLCSDPLGRKNVFALIRGAKNADGRTVILHGHTDTVGVEDYGPLKAYAYFCDQLRKKLIDIKHTLPADVRADLESGEWLFGRGAGDMKGGVAVFMAVMERLSEEADELSVNVLFMANPVEENLHTGVIEARLDRQNAAVFLPVRRRSERRADGGEAYPADQPQSPLLRRRRRRNRGPARAFEAQVLRKRGFPVF